MMAAAVVEAEEFRAEHLAELESIKQAQDLLTGKRGPIQEQQWPVFSPKIVRRDGKIIGLVFLQAELQIVAVDPRAALHIPEIGAELEAEAKKLGIRFVQAAVEPQARPVGKVLERYGFQKLSKEIETYYLDLEQRG